MIFDWDNNKSHSNIEKHGISFELASTVFEDMLHLSISDSGSQSEERWVTVGRAVNGQIIVVVHTYRVQAEREAMRIISARKATKRERRQYEEGI